MTKIKICGLRREEDIAYVNECKPDYVGFVFAKSKRQVTKEQAQKLKSLLNPDITAVGVFVNEEITKVAEYVQEEIIDMVQLHGDESDEYIKKLRRMINDEKIIKAVRVAGKEDVIASERISADYILFDTFSVGEYGGTGTIFDWEMVKEIKRPFFLAGGINGSNIELAVSDINPYAIDISSAVEKDGYKDREKIIDIVMKVRKS